ncbi:hypothetical protein CGI92_23185 [Vibrio parahaemolyticus]|nr:hypothetical protein CGI92_23185 [Vibrio parahaemolyticus]
MPENQRVDLFDRFDYIEMNVFGLSTQHTFKIGWNLDMTLSNFHRQQNQCTPLPHRLSVEKLGRIDAEALSDAYL